MKKIVIILGPTACGKSALAVNVAQRLMGEVISGDSMQVYRGMDVGTAKISRIEQDGVPHHLLDIRDPDQAFSAADFKQEAAAAIADIITRGRLPIVAGGTGLYLNTLIKPYNFSPVAASDTTLRQRIRAELTDGGGDALHQRLQSVDPEAAARIHPHDTHRLIRALEVYDGSGMTISELHRTPLPPPPYDALLIGLNLERELLYLRIEQRVDLMLEHGLIEETRRLLADGLGRDAVSMQGLGYRQLAAYLAGEISLDEATDLIKRDTRRFAKRQLTWFRRMENINWFYPDHYREGKELVDDVCALIAAWLKEE